MSSSISFQSISAIAVAQDGVINVADQGRALPAAARWKRRVPGPVHVAERVVRAQPVQAAHRDARPVHGKVALDVPVLGGGRKVEALLDYEWNSGGRTAPLVSKKAFQSFPIWCRMRVRRFRVRTVVVVGRM